MSKEEDINFLKIQTCVLKVSIHCDGCKRKVKKLLQKIDGVYRTDIDAEQGKVTVSGNFDPATLVRKLGKAGKHAELLAPKGGNNVNNLNAQFQKLQLQNGKGQQPDSGKPQKGGAGAGAGKEQKGGQQQQQIKGFKDPKLPQMKEMKLPLQKDQKNVKFSLAPEYGDDGSDYDDDFDYEGEDFDDMDGFEDDFDADPKNSKTKPMNLPPNTNNGMGIDEKGGGGGTGKKGGGGGGDAKVQIKGMGGNNGNGGGGGGGKNGGGGNQNHGGGKIGSGGVPQESKINGRDNKKGGEKIDVGGGGNPMGNPNAMMMMGQGMHAPMAHMGNIAPAAFQAPPAAAAAAAAASAAGVPPGYIQGGMAAPGMMAAAAAGPYPQQYMAAMLQQQQQQQQQRMMMNGYDGVYPPMGYPRPMPAAPNYFSDENPNGCSIM